jgi:hypothetical protein
VLEKPIAQLLAAQAGPSIIRIDVLCLSTHFYLVSVQSMPIAHCGRL